MMEHTPLRHAYLIMAHGNFPILEKQLRFLDSENAGFYIHIDAKVRDFDFEKFRAIPQRSPVVFADRYDVAWGHDTQIFCEMALLKAAARDGYDYYHLLSGVDAPVKTRLEIESFFQTQPGINYLSFNNPAISKRHLDRVRYYYPFQRWNIRSPLLRRGLRELTAAAQRLAGVDRTKKYPGFIFQKGSNWFSITDALVKYLLDREDEIREKFHDTCCGDEVFLHSMVMNSPFRDTLLPTAFSAGHPNCCRYIDWDRGNPYTFTEADFEELTHTAPGYLFARKFDYTSHPDIVDRLFEYFSE